MTHNYHIQPILVSKQELWELVAKKYYSLREEDVIGEAVDVKIINDNEHIDISGVIGRSIKADTEMREHDRRYKRLVALKNKRIADEN